MISLGLVREILAAEYLKNIYIKKGCTSGWVLSFLVCRIVMVARLIDQRVPWAITSKCTFSTAGDASLMLDMVEDDDGALAERPKPLLPYHVNPIVHYQSYISSTAPSQHQSHSF